MKLDLVFLFLFGCFIEFSHSGGHGRKDVHVKIWVPVYKHSHKHTHTVYKKPKEEKKIVIHKHVHEHGHGHNHDHKHGHKHKHGHHHGHKHHHDHDHKDHGGHHHDGHHHHYDDWSKHSELETFSSGKNFKPSPEIDSYSIIPTFNDVDSGLEEDGYGDDDEYEKTRKNVRNEIFRLTEASDSAAHDPIGKHYLTGSYKVDETHPYDYNSEYHKIFKAPYANINLRESSYHPDDGDAEYDAEEYGDHLHDDDVEHYESGPPEYEAHKLEALNQYFHNRIYS